MSLNKAVTGQSLILDLGKCHESTGHHWSQSDVSPCVVDRDRDGSDVENIALTSTTAANASNSQHLDSNLHLDAEQPILVFYNSKTPSRRATEVIGEMKSLLADQQVRDLAEENEPIRGLRLFENVRDLRVVACGGDGTVGWVLEGIDSRCWKEEQPPVAILPLGTGNDLARCLGWGGKCKSSDVPALLKKVHSGNIIKLDRWYLDFSDPVHVAADTANDIKEDIPCRNFNNYFGIGVDAEVARQFHIARSRFPAKFSSKLRNFLYYAKFWFEVGHRQTCKDLDKHIDIMCDGQRLDTGCYGPLQGIAVLNIASIYGGSRLWGVKAGRRKRKTQNGIVSDGAFWMPQDFGDQMIEIVGLKSAFKVGLAAGRVWKRGKRLAQCCEAVIRTKKSFPMQIDGEPWWQPPCRISVSLKNQVPVVSGSV